MYDKESGKDNGICLKQTDTFGCVISVAAMATGMARIDAIKFIGKDGNENGGLYIHEIFPFLLRHGIYPGLVQASFDPPIENFEFESISFKIPIESFPAILIVVPREGMGERHVVYWTGKEVLDPDPGCSQFLNDYKIMGWLPLVRLDNE